MGRVLLVFRLAVRDVRRRPVEALLLLVVITAATTSLALGLTLRHAADNPYDDTRRATHGADIVASAFPDPAGGKAADLAGLTALTKSAEVTAHSGPYPVTDAKVTAHGRTVDVQAEGRDTTPATVDQPKLTHGGWVRPGGVVLEAALADALGVGAGDSITLNGRTFQVAGVAVTAATLPYPEATDYSQNLGVPPTGNTGLVWLTQQDARGVAPSAQSLAYVLNLRLADPAAAPAFVTKHDPPENCLGQCSQSDPLPPHLEWWQQTRSNASVLTRNAEATFVFGGGLLCLLAIAGVVVLVGGRMADQTRRVGLLKAVGGTPRLVAAVLLAEHLGVALLAAAVGLLAGRLIAPVLLEPTAGLIGSTGTPSLTIAIVGAITAVALGVAVVATLVPAIRAARTSTVRALDDAARAPRRAAWLIALSARLPAPLLLALRVAGRRPRRLVLGVLSMAIAVAGIVAALSLYASRDTGSLAQSAELNAARIERLSQVLLIITVMLVALAAVNTVVITQATVLDARYSTALSRALGLTPRQVTTALAASQLIPALVGVALGIPAGLALIAVLSDDDATYAPLWQLLALVPCAGLVVAALTAIPARIGARRPPAQILQAEHA